MKTLVLCCVCLLAGVGEAVRSTPPPPTVEELSETLQHAYEAYTKKAIQATTGDEVSTLKSRVATLARQLVMQQLFVEERVRSDGDSGIKQVRHHYEGTRPYHSASHTGTSVASLHDHANNIRTVGLGEFIAVLNGVEFRTRHNDYGLRMPSRTSPVYHQVEEIPFPDVPPEVLQQQELADQITEMREWFKAWKNNDHSVRDYRKYFKPVLCYLEGAWTNSDSLEESFFSDRHFLDATSWFDLQEKVRYTSYTGGKSTLENFSYLPTTIMNMINGTYPQVAQWNYRILCHPLKRDVPLNRFRVVDDLIARMANKKTLMEHERTRAARFTLNSFDTDEWVDGKKNYGLLDELMAEVPGKDNYGANLYDESFDTATYPYNTTDTDTKLNVGYYHRWSRVVSKDAMGRTKRHRGFADENLFMAMTTQPKVAGVELNVCTGWHHNHCTLYNQKWTYAIPLEVVYMTPLLKWNPYDVEYKGNSRSDLGKTVTAHGRWGSDRQAEKAFNGTNSKRYYQTPYEFFVNGEQGTSEADTVKSHVGVLDRAGQMHKMTASGTRTFLPFIPNVGSMRTRFPIMPVHGEGSGVWKELEALKDIVLSPVENAHMFHENWRDVTTQGVVLISGEAKGDKHVHRVVLSADQVGMAKLGRTILVVTEETNNHYHEMRVKRLDDTHYYMVGCDGGSSCPDKHYRTMHLAPAEDDENEPGTA
ncbi:hypothetical protein NP493_1090g00063 [Ridgeia piscesae]|uniref:Uncharacterized protein n=1 Tax=Ridgeia piscesae TaxID=27915 RepID=A0AAD9NK47_RIDPI|nr:hypothetical protein NP493_1090g00063 [Ridgeia piscesae]